MGGEATKKEEGRGEEEEEQEEEKEWSCHGVRCARKGRGVHKFWKPVYSCFLASRTPHVCALLF